MVVLKKGDKFTDRLGEPCFISYIKGDVVKLTYFVDGGTRVDVWKKDEFIADVNRFAFIQQPKTPITRENICEHLIEYQLNMVGKTLESAKDDEEWYSNITMNSVQHEVFKSYAIPLIRKVFKCNKKRAETTFAWFDLSYGLRIKN